MKKSPVFRAAAASAILLGFSVAAHAQSEPQKTDKPVPAQGQKPAKKPHKVWTDDNLSAVRTPQTAYIAATDKQSPAGTPAAQDASEKQPVAGSQKPGKVAPLSHAKSLEDAENKIEWEKRDIQGQEEYLVRMQGELEQAPPDQKEHIQKLIEQHKQILADTRNELKGLEDQKKDFQNNPAGQSASANQQPPSQ